VGQFKRFVAATQTVTLAERNAEWVSAAYTRDTTVVYIGFRCAKTP
jgi:hypothetical protein